jgi:PAS domain S-box-containing protein
MLPSLRCEQVLAAILESAEEAIIGIALDGSIELWSRGAERLYGYTEAEVTGAALILLLPIYERPSLQAVLQAAREGNMLDCETVERLHKMGAKLSVGVRRQAMRDGRGIITGILEIGRATRQKTQDTPSETQLRLLVEQMPVLLWTTDQSLRITSNWGSGLQHSDVHAGDLVGRTVSEYLKCNDTNAGPIAHHYAALRGDSAHFEYKRQDRILDIHVDPLRAPSGEIMGCIGVGLDITVRKRSCTERPGRAGHQRVHWRGDISHGWTNSARIARGRRPATV